MNKRNQFYLKLLWLALFAVAMGYLEATVVVYLRELFYPGSFPFPVRTMPPNLLVIEILRETATMLMLVAVAVVAGKKLWERFGFLLILFGIWDIFYYVWLRAAIGWPASLVDWDILFLIPIPWLSPVIAPALVALLMIVVGTVITDFYDRGIAYRPNPTAWLLALAGTSSILYSFMNNTRPALLNGAPGPYLYSLLLTGLILYGLAFFVSVRKVMKNPEENR